MKHIKSYKIFESSKKYSNKDKLDDIRKNTDYIFQELEDDGFEVSSVFSEDEDEPVDEFFIEIKLPASEHSRMGVSSYNGVFKWIDVKDSVNHMLSYLQTNRWFYDIKFYEKYRDGKEIFHSTDSVVFDKTTSSWINRKIDIKDDQQLGRIIFIIIDREDGTWTTTD